ncbi:hypothetical protein PLESTB_001036400 [Pleodorina starrii]|uniref:SET domain-containing protein n=1 Tax=Pleodorina starrii TaxID=330485 RepID=A0A9W6F484_9CHLO|nr:hypothetical protein PLESTB_001036400 [Pleodorina starrii]GLC63844.1 hypothetical protein PLESTF_000089100 [Pleodorina starrii]
MQKVVRAVCGAACQGPGLSGCLPLVSSGAIQLCADAQANPHCGLPPLLHRTCPPDPISSTPTLTSTPTSISTTPNPDRPAKQPSNQPRWAEAEGGSGDHFSGGFVGRNGASGFEPLLPRRHCCTTAASWLGGGVGRRDDVAAEAAAAAAAVPASEADQATQRAARPAAAASPSAQTAAAGGGAAAPLPESSQVQPPSPSPSPSPLRRPLPSAAELLAPLLEGKPFTVVQVPGRGRGVVATRSIRAGEVVHLEVPLLTFPELGAARGVCYHCLSPVDLSPSPVRHRGPSGRRFCCDACLAAAREQYLEVEEAAAEAAGAAAASRRGGAAGTAAAASADGGGGGGPLSELYEQCRVHGERFPLMAARLVFMEVSEAVRQYLLPLRGTRSRPRASSEETSAPPAAAAAAAGEPSGAATTADAGNDADTNTATVANPSAAGAGSGGMPVAVRGDPLRGVLSVLCFANLTPPYPEPWLQQHGLLAAALRNLAADPKALRNLAVAAAATSSRPLPEQEAGRRREEGSGGGAGPGAGEDADGDGDSWRAAVEAAAADGLGHTVAAVVDERLDVEWFVGVMARLHLNVFQVHNPLAGADPSDLAAAAAALVSGTAGGASSGSAVYQLASLFNHSCEPTLELSFPSLDATAAFTAARDIAPGEELCVSYLDVGLPYAARRRHLEWSYGFVCGCARCREEEEEQEAEAEERGRGRERG